ncbi:targeting protein for Xklp2-like [Plectropomus leopardus]|uniref:targeting protein for Xklp2-like n=1 Tax=Plectropomus leopardus TaxID=160734 RepID=UPI001C4CE926|nr:targeting protein for Xklp2-like [Plectropomus leopardus]
MMAESDSGDTSERYEFDAPSHVVDLMELQNAENEDQWFEQQTDAADGHLKTPLRPGRPFRRSQADLPRAIVVPQVKLDEDTGPSTSTSQPPNIVTSWGAGSPVRAGARPKRKTANQPPAQSRRVSKRKEMSSSPAPPPSKKNKITLVARKSNSALRRKVQQTTRSGPVTRASASANTEPNSSEEQELERIRNLQREVALHRKKNEASYKAALAGNPPPKKMVLSATVPKEFHFNTNSRVKATTSSNTSHKDVDFITQLRKPSSPAKAIKGATVPKPFNLSTGNKKGGETAAYVPMAQQIEQFQKRTPDRFHLHSRRSRERGPSPTKGDHLKLTQPHTPHLMTRQRSRPTTVKSSAELEAEELEKLQK